MRRNRRWAVGICIGLVALIGGLVMLLPRDREAPVIRSSDHVQPAEVAAAQLAPAGLEGSAPESLRTEIATDAPSGADLGAATERSPTEEESTDEDLDSEKPEPIWAFHGVVIDARTREPVPSAEVTFYFEDRWWHTYSDDDGKFALELEEGEEGDEEIWVPLLTERVSVRVEVDEPLDQLIFEGDGMLRDFHTIEVGGSLRLLRGRVTSGGPWPFGPGFRLRVRRIQEDDDLTLATAVIDGNGEFAVQSLGDPSIDNLYFELSSGEAPFRTVPERVRLERIAGSGLVLDVSLAQATIRSNLPRPYRRPPYFGSVLGRALGRLEYAHLGLTHEPVAVLFAGSSIDVLADVEDRGEQRFSLLPNDVVDLRPGKIPWCWVEIQAPAGTASLQSPVHVVGVPVTPAELQGNLWRSLCADVRHVGYRHLRAASDPYHSAKDSHTLGVSATLDATGAGKLYLPWNGPWFVFTGTRFEGPLHIGHIADPTSGVVWRE